MRRLSLPGLCSNSADFLPVSRASDLIDIMMHRSSPQQFLFSEKDQIKTKPPPWQGIKGIEASNTSGNIELVHRREKIKGRQAFFSIDHKTGGSQNLNAHC
jgi:hypothetical protein